MFFSKKKHNRNNDMSTSHLVSCSISFCLMNLFVSYDYLKVVNN